MNITVTQPATDLASHCVLIYADSEAVGSVGIGESVSFSAKGGLTKLEVLIVGAGVQQSYFTSCLCGSV